MSELGFALVLGGAVAVLALLIWLRSLDNRRAERRAIKQERQAGETIAGLGDAILDETIDVFFLERLQDPAQRAAGERHARWDRYGGKLGVKSDHVVLVGGHPPSLIVSVLRAGFANWPFFRREKTVTIPLGEVAALVVYPRRREIVGNSTTFRLRRRTASGTEVHVFKLDGVENALRAEALLRRVLPTTSIAVASVSAGEPSSAEGARS